MTLPQIEQPTTATIAAHLAAEHRFTGIRLDDIAGTDPIELLRWHDVDHRLVAAAFLGHEHSHFATARRIIHEDPDRAIHEANLRRIRTGGTIPNLDDILRRAAEAANRRTAPRHDPTTGVRIPGAGHLSRPDLDALEIAQAVAERTARRAGRRRGRAA